MNEETYDPHALGTMMAAQGDSAARVFALTTAIELGLMDEAQRLVYEAILEGPDSVTELAFGVAGAFNGIVALYCDARGVEPREFVATMATGFSTMAEVGREVVRICEGNV